MKVLHVGKFFFPEVGGMESVLFDLVEGLNQSGVCADVLCANRSALGVEEYLPGGYTVTRSSTVATVASTSVCPGMPASLRRLAPNYDVIHVHLPNPMANLALLFAGYRGKVVLHWHSDIVKQRLLQRLYAPLLRWLLGRADAIIATSPPYAESSPDLLRWRHKVSVVPIGINEQSLTVDHQFLEQERARYKAKKVVFALGRMTYYKGFKYLIDAARHLPDDVMVLIGGGGELAEDMGRRIERFDLAGKVKLLGKIPVQHLGAYYALCDLFCLPSIARSEAFGVVLLEAMSFGKPIVATNIPGSGVSWVTKHEESGLNVPIEDSLALAQAINKLVANDLLRKSLGAAARKRFEAQFVAHSMVAATAKVYQELCS